MNKRRTIYRGFNKRRKTRVIKIAAIGMSICLIGGYAYIKAKDMKVFTKLSSKVSLLTDKIPSFSLDNFKFEKPKVTSSGDISKELEAIQKEKSKEVENKNEKVEKQSQSEVSEDIKLAIIEGWNLHTVQVASVENDNDIPKIEKQLTDNKIPFSVVEIDGLKKVQTYAFFDQESTRSHMDEVKKVFPDAFLSQMKVPLLSLEYTNKYSYVEDISKQLNNLISNFKEESKFWASNKEKVDLSEYNNILTSRRKIIEDIKKETDKIDYSNMDVFKQNLVKYLNDMDEKITMASKAANEQNYYVSESLYLSSMQGYFSFINSINKA
ncbi:hypothetical protein [Clostridium sp. CCUG 7971]|uniref:hypothetical protein n=1 Tax=Clostridium sp. CCUG 7971 TaxID=2811414 RepID=UPI001ABBAA51|nr:hypothetical protein [Clostridium sp. CCUG 7971]MBO3445684.1 hypothetical protein [Clostridium sp. CCUG 7971]